VYKVIGLDFGVGSSAIGTLLMRQDNLHGWLIRYDGLRMVDWEQQYQADH